MLIDDPPALATAGDDGQLLKLDALRLKYQALVSTDLIAQPVATQLHLPVGDVLGSVTAVVPYQSLADGRDRDLVDPSQCAQRLAQATANEVTKFVKYESEVYNIPAIDRYTFIVIDPATAATARPPFACARADPRRRARRGRLRGDIRGDAVLATPPLPLPHVLEANGRGRGSAPHARRRTRRPVRLDRGGHGLPHRLLAARAGTAHRPLRTPLPVGRSVGAVGVRAAPAAAVREARASRRDAPSP